MHRTVRAQGTVFAAQFVAALAFWAYSPLVEYIRQDLLLTAAHIGLVPLVLDAAGLLAAPIGGWVTDRAGVTRAYLVVLVGSVAGLAVMGATAVYPVVLLGAALIGWQFATAGPLTNRMVSVAAPRTRYGLAYSVKQSSVTLAMAAWLVAAPALADRFGWRVALLALAGVVGTAGVALATAVARADRAAGDRSRAAVVGAGILTALRRVGATAAMRWMFAIGFCFQGVQFAFMTFAIPLLVDRHGLTAGTAAAALAATQAAAVLSRPLIGWLSDLTGARSRPLLLALIAAVVGVSLPGMALAGSPAAAVGWLLVGGVVGFAWIGIYFARLADLWPAQRLGFATGVTLVPIKIGGTVIPAPLGLGIARVSYAAAFCAFGLLLLGGAGVVAWVHRAGGGPALPEHAPV